MTYHPTIGLEIHAELKTQTKMFCDSANVPDADEPNVNVCPVCMAHPGTLPMINKSAVHHVLRIGAAVGGELADYSEFDRKNYFYPDIPKGYQISQYEYPLVQGGRIAGVDLTRIHLEEDTASLIHADTDSRISADENPRSSASKVNFNRAGVPLMELVTEPVVTSGAQAGAFGRELQLLLRYLGASDANMEKGELRIEANVSVSEVADERGYESPMNTDTGGALLYEDLTYEVRGALYTVHNALGHGHKESVYQKALAEEFSRRGISYEREKSIPVAYNETEVGRYQPDFVIDEKILLELKAMPDINRKDKEQTWQYLKGSPYRLALLANLGARSVQIERIVYDEIRDNPHRNQRQSTLGTKVEVKNLNSFRSVERAIAYEIERQTALLEQGEAVQQETRGWDEHAEKTYAQRAKETSEDYRYFPDPDLPKLKLSEVPEFSYAVLHDSLPELPWDKRERYTQTFGLKEEAIATLTGDLELASYFERIVQALGEEVEKVVLAANYVTSDLLGRIETPLSSISLRPETFAELIQMAYDEEISSRGAKDILGILLTEGGTPREIAESRGLLQQSDEGALQAVVEEVVSEHAQVAEDYRNGKESALQFLVGQGMKMTKGSANPQVLKQLFEEKLK